MGLATTTDTTASLRRAAILLTTLDAGVARRMLDALPPVRRAVVRRAMTTLADVDPLERKRALQDFLAEASRGGPRTADAASDSARHPQQGAQDTAAPMAGRPQPAAAGMPEAAPLAFLNDVRDEVLLTAVAGEHPQTVAIVLASLAPHQAARLLPRLDPSLRQQAMMRLGRLEHLPPDALDSIGDHLRRLLADTQPQKIGGGAGGRSLMAILAEMPHEMRDPLAQSLDLDPVLIDALRSDTSPAAATAGDPRANTTAGSLRVAPATLRQDDPGTAAAPRGRVTAESGSAATAAQHRQFRVLDPLAAADDDTEPAGMGRAFGGGQDSDPDAVDHHLLTLAPHELRDALAAVEARDALLALCGLEAGITDAVLALLPRRQARQVRKQLQAIGPLQLRDIDRAKQRVAIAAGWHRHAPLTVAA